MCLVDRIKNWIIENKYIFFVWLKRKNEMIKKKVYLNLLLPNITY